SIYFTCSTCSCTASLLVLGIPPLADNKDRQRAQTTTIMRHFPGSEGARDFSRVQGAPRLRRAGAAAPGNHRHKQCAPKVRVKPTPCNRPLPHSPLAIPQPSRNQFLMNSTHNSITTAAAREWFQ